MTREEAIKRLEDTFEGWNMWVMDNDSPASKMSKALGMAIAALREQEERSKGCEFCAETLKRFDHVLAVADYCEDDIVYEPKFCPMCGLRLEDT